ncbi:unnamed protein product, partial [Gulo gulo]
LRVHDYLRWREGEPQEPALPQRIHRAPQHQARLPRVPILCRPSARPEGSTQELIGTCLYGAHSQHLLHSYPSFYLSRTLDFSTVFQGHGAEEWMGLEDGGRKVGRQCAHGNGCTGRRYTAMSSSTGILWSRTRTSVGCVCDFSQISQCGDVSMCVIPLMSVSEHVFRGRGI